MELLRITPPRTASVVGGRKTVVCSWRGRGIGASGVHGGWWVGWEKVSGMIVKDVRRSRKVDSIVGRLRG